MIFLVINTVLLVKPKNLERPVSHSDDILIIGDRTRITQVISNLLDNTLKFTPEGVVSVYVVRNKRKVEEQDHQEEAIVTVEDTGSGINPEIFPRP